MLTRLMRHYEDHLLEQTDCDQYVHGLRQLRILMSGTSALPSPLREKWTRLTDGKRILERYGASKFSTAILTPLHDNLKVPDGSVGVALSGCDVRLATELEGEILVKSSGMLLGYHLDPGVTRAAFD
ncbi:uncharacterized protein J7T54_001424 [Emericellopsis cladophorae]|uniref:AMP-dependent synthetase/ligase domain-containing protein n=1 Tax=Emericellopsis cladophorae TaxID=2686198 RepID=A0A9Q0BDJ9_9HYPO|nr:uncharacterized protein J7T54_001424 [Emericellopsis cladophorae]KAI6781462.1 hypothetical protein J7T54_001424 [Emericellopsis cladophorae]